MGASRTGILLYRTATPLLVLRSQVLDTKRIRRSFCAQTHSWPMTHFIEEKIAAFEHDWLNKWFPPQADALMPDMDSRSMRERGKEWLRKTLNEVGAAEYKRGREDAVDLVANAGQNKISMLDPDTPRCETCHSGFTGTYWISQNDLIFQLTGKYLYKFQLARGVTKDWSQCNDCFDGDHNKCSKDSCQRWHEGTQV